MWWYLTLLIGLIEHGLRLVEGINHHRNVLSVMRFS